MPLPGSLLTLFGILLVIGACSDDPVSPLSPALTYTINETGLNDFYNDMVSIAEPSAGESYYGQDANYRGTPFSFVDNEDNTISDLNTGLMWQKVDDGVVRDWQEALQYTENLELAGYSDWYLPDVKELQSIVDYSRNDPALNTSFLEMSDQDGWFWSGSTFKGATYRIGIYIAFGKAVNYLGVDTHGAGALRGDFKSGYPADWSTGLGPQQDEVRIYNYVRAVRPITVEE